MPRPRTGGARHASPAHRRSEACLRQPARQGPRSGGGPAMDRQPLIDVLPNASAVIDSADELVRVAASAAIAARGRFTLALSGGRTPNALYQALAAPPGPGRA